MEYQRLIYEKKDRIGIVTISRPEARNAWSDLLYLEMEDVFHKMEEDQDILVTILTGDQRGKAFSAGADVANPKTHVVTDISEVGERLGGLKKHVSVFNLMMDYPKPIICAINGYAIGIGGLVCLCCDILIASDNAEWGQTQVSLGILPAQAGAVRLARFVGKGNAMRLTLMSERIKADEMLRIGLVTQVVPLPELMPTAMKIAERIASFPPISVRLGKESLNRGLEIPSIKDAALADNYRFLLLMQMEDTKEAHKAWREKRKPVFKGR